MYNQIMMIGLETGGELCTMLEIIRLDHFLCPQTTTVKLPNLPVIPLKEFNNSSWNLHSF
jgi:hypothetical protein